MDPAYVVKYAELYRRHWWWRSREKLTLKWLEQLKPESGFGLILDVGSGSGLFLEALSRFGQPEGVEADGAWAKHPTPGAGRVHYRPFDATFRPNRRYGLILMLDVIEHMDDEVGALGHALELLEDDGLLVVTVPAFNCLWTRHDELNRHVPRYTKRSLHEAFEKAGGRVRTMHYFFHWLFVAKLLTRLKEALIPAPAKLPGIPPRWLNSLLVYGSTAEFSLSRSLPIPFGASLVAIARKCPIKVTGYVTDRSA